MDNNADVYFFDLIFDLKICVRYTDMELRDRRMWHALARPSAIWLLCSSPSSGSATSSSFSHGALHVNVCANIFTLQLCFVLLSFLFLLLGLPRGPLHSYVIFHGMEFSKINPTGFLLAGIM